MKWHTIVVRFLMVALSGSVMTLSCTGLTEKLANNVNPCGTILNCDPVEYDLLTTDFPDWDIDPTCTIPGQCGGTWPVNGGGTAATQ
jgi:hypothetical protein